MDVSSVIPAHVLERFPVALCICEAPTGLIHSFNKHAVDLWGRQPQAGHEKFCGSFRIFRRDGTFVPHDQCPMAITLRSGIVFHNEEIIIERPDGSRVVSLVNTSPMRDDLGEIFGAINALLDVPARVRDSASTHRLKDEFLAVLSHELRTPLSAIVGWASILESGKKLDDQQMGTALESIARNAKALTTLVDDLLDLSRIDTGKLKLELQDVSLQMIVAAAVDSIRQLLRQKQIQFKRTIDPGVPVIRGDPNRLQQVFWNLLSNAIKFTPSGGSVELIIQPRDQHIECRICDNGIGIRPEFLPHIFERFAQSDAAPSRSTGGLGIGLSIVRSIVEMHGGSVEAYSDGDGRGAAFRFTLPMSYPQAD